MTNKIWKFELQITDYQEVTMPHRSEILSVGNQNGSIYLWAFCQGPRRTTATDEIERKEIKRIRTIGTGNPIQETFGHLKFIGTVFQNEFVWHIFEERPENGE